MKNFIVTLLVLGSAGAQASQDWFGQLTCRTLPLEEKPSLIIKVDQKYASLVIFKADIYARRADQWVKIRTLPVSSIAGLSGGAILTKHFVGDQFEVFQELDLTIDEPPVEGKQYERAFAKGYAEGKPFHEALTCEAFTQDPDLEPYPR